MPVVIDTDPGIDDALALALAARSPELDIVAVTTTYGNTTLARATRNARAVLALAGHADLPVSPGADRPLRGRAPAPSERHGAGGAGYAEVTEPPRPVTPDADALFRALASHPPGGGLVLVTLGPLTNLAHALARDAALVRARVGRHIAILDHDDTTTPPGRGFNGDCDLAAVDRVLAAGLPTEVVGLAVTRRLVLPRATVERLRASADPLVRWLTDALRWAVEVQGRRFGLEGCWAHDVVAVAAACAPLLDFGAQDAEIGTARVALAARVDHVCRLLDRVFGPGWDQPSSAGGA